MSDPYVYKDTDVIRNKYDIRDLDRLEKVERRNAQDAALKPIENFEVSYDGFKDIHRHLFGETYEWAGYSRAEDTPFEGEMINPMVNISKGRSSFAPATFIERITPKYFEQTKLELDNSLKENVLDEDRFANVAATHIADLNHAHPFREGNGRTMRVYLDYLAKDYGFELKARSFDKDKWMDASIKTMTQGHEPMKALILENLERSKEKKVNQEERTPEKTAEDIARKKVEEAGLEFVQLVPNKPGKATFVEKMQVEGTDYALIRDGQRVGMVKMTHDQKFEKGQEIHISPDKSQGVVMERRQRHVEHGRERDEGMER